MAHIIPEMKRKGVNSTMAVNFSESRTKENLMRAFAGESQARNRYTVAAKTAGEQGMHQTAEMFRYNEDEERADATGSDQLSTNWGG